jgi:hypothetical protein
MLIKNFFFIFILFLFTKGFSIFVGNPSEPTFFSDGIFTSDKKNISLRLAYLYDNIYNAKFLNNTVGITNNISLKTQMQGSVITLNFFNRLDLLAILSNCKTTYFDTTENNKMFDSNFGWGVGLKLLFFKSKNMDLSIGSKYFETTQKPNYFVIEDIVFLTNQKFSQKIQILQASLAMSYRTNFLSPYVGAIASCRKYTKILPKPLVLTNLEGGGITALFQTKDSSLKDVYGLVAGMSVSNLHKNLNLTIETRYIDLFSYAFIGSFRF